MMCPVFQDTPMKLIQPKEVVMGEVEEKKVGDQLEFLAKLFRKDGRKVVINTPFFHLNKLVFDKFGQDIDCIQVPMTEWLRIQIKNIEQAVDDQVKLPDSIEHLGIIMKQTFLKGPHTNVVTSNYLKFIPCDNDGNVIAKDVDNIDDIVDTEFSFRIEFPHVYMGMHKNGQTVSCSTRVVAIRYKTTVNEEDNDDTDVDLDNDDTNVKLTPNTKLSPEEMAKIAKPKPKLKRLNSAK